MTICEIVFGKFSSKFDIILFSKLIEFDDPKNRGTYDGKSEVKKYPMSDFNWTREIRHEDESTLDISFMGGISIGFFGPKNGPNIGPKLSRSAI